MWHIKRVSSSGARARTPSLSDICLTFTHKPLCLGLFPVLGSDYTSPRNEETVFVTVLRPQFKRRCFYLKHKDGSVRRSVLNSTPGTCRPNLVWNKWVSLSIITWPRQMSLCCTLFCGLSKYNMYLFIVIPNGLRLDVLCILSRVFSHFRIYRNILDQTVDY